MIEEERLFPAIGEVVEKTGNAPEAKGNGAAVLENDDDRPFQEIESLCVSCGENVTEVLLQYA